MRAAHQLGRPARHDLGARGRDGDLQMKRFERRRVERLRRTALMIGLSFALGALIDTALTWRLHEFDLGGGETAETAGAAPASVEAGSDQPSRFALRRSAGALAEAERTRPTGEVIRVSPPA